MPIAYKDVLGFRPGSQSGGVGQAARVTSQPGLVMLVRVCGRTFHKVTAGGGWWLVQWRRWRRRIYSKPHVSMQSVPALQSPTVCTNAHRECGLYTAALFRRLVLCWQASVNNRLGLPPLSTPQWSLASAAQSAVWPAGRHGPGPAQVHASRPKLLTKLAGSDDRLLSSFYVPCSEAGMAAEGDRTHCRTASRRPALCSPRHRIRSVGSIRNCPRSTGGCRANSKWFRHHRRSSLLHRRGEDRHCDHCEESRYGF